MRKQLFSLGLTVTSLSMVGGIAYAATQSVSTRPSSQVVVPSAAEHARGADDNATTTVVPDDRRMPTTSPAPTPTTPTPPTTPTTRATIPTTPVTVDDRGRGRSGLDDVTRSVPTTRRTIVSSVPSTVVDDQGGAATSGRSSGSSGSGPSGSGRSGHDG